jgi:hypothetical protein
MFDLKVWKIEAKKRLEGWANRWEAARQSGVQSLYAFLCSMALWPVVEAGQRGEFAALAALGHVAAGIGGNLIANMIQTWKDEAGGAQEIEKRVSCEPAIRDALDNILEKLDMLPQAGSELPDTEKAWFQKMLEGELRHLGNIARFRSVLIGPGAVAGAPGAKAASGGAVISDEIEDSVISTGPGSRNIKAVHYYEVRPGVDTSESKPAGLEASDDPPALECAYLDKLIRKVRDLPLPGIDPRAVTEEETSRPQLSAVYTALMTHRTEADPLCVAARRGPDMLPGERSESAPRKISALQVVNSEPRLVLLGDPGSGKSAFINFLTLCLAGERLGLQDANLRLLTEPIPEGTDERDESKRQPWDHDNLLPVRVVLRDFAVRGLPPGGKKADGGHLWDFIVSELGSLERSYAAYLKQQLTSGKALVMLDGLDEVPEAEKRRRQVKDAVSDFALTFRSCRILVTSRRRDPRHGTRLCAGPCCTAEERTGA